MKKIIIISYLTFILSCSSDSMGENGWKNSEKKNALIDCISSGNSEEFCDCSVVILTSLFSYEEFNTFNREIRSVKQPSSETASKMIEMYKRVQSECPKPLQQTK